MNRRNFFGAIATAGLAGCLPLREAPLSHRAVPTILVSSVASASSMPTSGARGFVPLLQEYVSYLRPVWGVNAEIKYAQKPDKAAWNIIFVDKLVDAPNALAYHAFDTNVAPMPYALVGTADQNLLPLTVTATHELGEMLVDPGCQMWAGLTPPNDGKYETWRTLLALEIADPVEAYTFNIGETPVSDFVYPAYFEPWRDGQIDQCDRIGYHELGDHGYQIVREDDEVAQVFKVGTKTGVKVLPSRCHRFDRIMRKWQRQPRQPQSQPEPSA